MRKPHPLSDLDADIRDHIERETLEHIERGMSPDDARYAALRKFGNVTRPREDARAVWSPRWLDELRQDVRYSMRMFRRAPLAAFTIVGTIALGLGLIAVVFTLFNAFFLRADAVRGPAELFELERPSRRNPDISVPFTRTEYEVLRRETSVFADVAAMGHSIETRIAGRIVSATLVTGNFFQMLGVQAARGRTLTPRDDEPGAGRPIVLSHKGWIKLFQGDPVIGRTVLVNGIACEIVGVTPEAFRGLDTGPPDYWAPLALAEFRQASSDRESDTRVDVVGRLKPGMSAEQAAAGLSVWAARRAEANAADERPRSITLEPRNGTLTSDWLFVLGATSPIFFAFGSILMIGCANVANLLLARGISRQREIGIRLSLGAPRRRIVRQLLTESLILALAAAACGLALSRTLMFGALYAARVAMPAELAVLLDVSIPPADWRVLAFLLAGAIISTVSFGLLPALQATRVELVRANRGEVTRGARQGRARHVLIGVQVGASALLLICAAVLLRSALAAAMVDPGLRTSDTIKVPIANEPRRAAIIREVMTHPSVAGVAAQSRIARASAFGLRATADTHGDAAATPTSVPIDYKFVSPEYFGLFDIPVLRGRGFTSAERTGDAGVAVVSEGAARRLWPNGEAMGQIVRISAANPADREVRSASPAPLRAYTVIGVARDVAGHALFQHLAFSGVYFPSDPQNAGTQLALRVRGDVEQARLVLLDALTRVDPALDHEVMTYRTAASTGIYILQIMFWVTLVLGGLALALTLSGLFSVLSYLVEQRAKDIGVRLALGATGRQIVALVLSQSARAVAFGLFAGGGLAAALAIGGVLATTPAGVVMATPGAPKIGNVIHALDPAAYAASVLVIFMACGLAASIPALRAARLDPIATLRQD